MDNQKVGKSDFLISLLAHMAVGTSFLGFSPARSLRIFYLQDEVQYHYLRERIQRLQIPQADKHSLYSNFIVTSQISLVLNDDGLHDIVNAIKNRFGDALP